MLSKSKSYLLLALFLLISFLLTDLRLALGSQDLLSLYEKAKSSDPVLKKAISELNASLSQKPLARSLLMPKLQAEIGQGYYGKKITGLGPEEVKKDFWGENYSVRLIQPIFDGQAYISLKMAQSLINASEAQVLVASQELIKKVAIAYFNVLDAKAMLITSQNKLELLKEVLNKARAYLKNGMGDIVSVKEAEARYEIARAQMIRSKNDLALAKENLSILVHSPIDEILDIGRFNILGPEPDDIKKWIKAALENQPILKSAKNNLILAEQKIEHERRARWPRIDLEAVGAYADGQFLPDVIYREAHGVLRFTIPIYLGGSIGAKTAIAQNEAISARHKLDYLNDIITLQTKRAFLKLKDSIAITQASQKALQSAKISLEATKKGYEVGTKDIIDLLDMTDKYIEAKQQLFHAIYNHIKARIELKAAAGLIGEADIKALNKLLANGKGIEQWER